MEGRADAKIAKLAPSPDAGLLHCILGESHVAGARGETHDWTVSREIVEQSKIPVILAGGLTAENVGEAIATVRPWGVDSFTHTDVAGSRGKKDAARVRAFIAAALRGFATVLEGGK